MNLRKLPDPYREAVALFEALRRLGFSADDIYFQAMPHPTCYEMARVILRTQGKQFILDAGPLRDDENFQAGMLEVVELIRQASQGDLTRFVWRKSKIGTNAILFASLVVAIEGKGIRVPVRAGEAN